MKHSKHHGEIQEGIFIPEDKKAYDNETKSFEGKKITVVRKKYRPYKQRSLDQNNYWHAGICGVLSDENGDTPLFWHKYLKVKFILKRIIGREPDMFKLMDSGRLDEIASMITTTSLSKIDHMQITSEIRSWASSEFGIYLLTPEEYWQKISNEPEHENHSD